MVALLPTVQTVGGRVFLRFLAGFGVIVRDPRAQLVSERVQHMRNMVVQLLAGQRRSGGQLRIAFYGIAPCLQDRRLARGELRGQIGELRMELVVAVHGVVKRKSSAARAAAVAKRLNGQLYARAPG